MRNKVGYIDLNEKPKVEFVEMETARPKLAPGNAAAMREALEQIAHMNDDGLHDESTTICSIVAKCKAALAAPPRNCDRFATAKAADEAIITKQTRNNQ